MESNRILVVGLCIAAALVALLAPWRYALVEPLCIFEPCEEPYVTTSPGYVTGGVFLAPLAGVAAAVAAFATPRVAKLVAAPLLVGATLVGALAPVAFGFVIFGEELGPAWGSVLAAILSLAALVVVASMDEDGEVSAPSASASGPLP